MRRESAAEAAIRIPGPRNAFLKSLCVCTKNSRDESRRRRDLSPGGRFADPGPNSSSRRRSRGAKGRFGPLVDRPWPMQRAAEDGSDPGAAGTSGATLGATGFSRAQSQHMSWPGRGGLTAVLRVGRSPPPGAFVPRLGRRSRRWSRRWSRSGPRKFEFLYVDGSDVLGRRHIGRRSRRRRSLPQLLFLSESRTR